MKIFFAVWALAALGVLVTIMVMVLQGWRFEPPVLKNAKASQLNFEESGTYEITIPSGVTRIKIQVFNGAGSGINSASGIISSSGIGSTGGSTIQERSSAGQKGEPGPMPKNTNITHDPELKCDHDIDGFAVPPCKVP